MNLYLIRKELNGDGELNCMSQWWGGGLQRLIDGMASGILGVFYLEIIILGI